MRSPTDAHWRVSNLAQYRGEPPGIEVFRSRVAMCAARSPRSRRDRQYLHYRSRRWRAHSRVWRSGWCKDVPPPQRSQTTRRSYQPRLRMRAPDSKTRLTLTCAMSVLCHALARNPSPGRVAALGARVRIRAHAARWLNSAITGHQARTDRAGDATDFGSVAAIVSRTVCQRYPKRGILLIVAG